MSVTEMNEALARQIALVRAIESADQHCAIVSVEDRRLASLGAREQLASASPTADGVTQSTATQFIGYRAALLLRQLAQRYPVLTTLAGHSRHLALVSILIPALAFIVGIAVDRIADPHRVDLLSAPLLGILVWNLAVYAAMLLWPLLKRPASPWIAGSGAQWLHAASTRLAQTLPGPLHAGLLDFALEWRRLSGPLDAARIGRTLHLSAALFAAGATLSLYLRGFLTQYAAGWESTFLDPSQLQAVLSIVFAPARIMFQLQPFSLADIEALRFTHTGSGATGNSGARWVHLYAATLLLLVILPRLVLAGLAHRRARRWVHDFPLSLAQPYFRRLTGLLGNTESILRVLPYSIAPDDVRSRGLQRIAAMLLGERSRVALAASTDYGAEAAGTPVPAGDFAMTAVLFNLSATPETQNHGAFLTQVAQSARAAGQQMVVLVDESGYLARLGAQAGAAERIAERIALWQAFCRLHEVRAIVVDLIEPQRRALELEGHHRIGGYV